MDLWGDRFEGKPGMCQNWNCQLGIKGLVGSEQGYQCDKFV